MPKNALNRVIHHLRSAVLQHGGCPLTDSQLLECFIEQRDEGAVEVLMRRHGPMVLGVCRRVLGNIHDAEDAFQATFLVLVRKALSIKPREMVGNWLYGVAHQTALRAKVAAAKRCVRERQVMHMPEPNNFRDDLWGDMLPLLDQELSRLPAKYRASIVLCDLEGKTHKEAARHLGCPQGTLAARLSRARVMLAKRLTRQRLAVSAGTMAALLSQKAASACVPPALIASTLKVATLTAAGQAAIGGGISAEVAALTQGVLKAMLLTKLKIATAVTLVVAVTVTSAALLSFPTQAAGPLASSKPDAQPQKKKDKSTYLLRVPSHFEGFIQFIGTEIKEGEKVPPEKTITAKIGGVKKQFRRLKKGDAVGEGQLLGRLDDRFVRSELAVKRIKAIGGKADSDGALAIANEAEEKLKTAESLFARKVVGAEDYRSAMLTRNKMWFDSISKQEAAKLAEAELQHIETVIELYDIRAAVSGVIATILKRPGEAVKKGETVLEIEATENNE